VQIRTDGTAMFELAQVERPVSNAIWFNNIFLSVINSDRFPPSLRLLTTRVLCSLRVKTISATRSSSSCARVVDTLIRSMRAAVTAGKLISAVRRHNRLFIAAVYSLSKSAHHSLQLHAVFSRAAFRWFILDSFLRQLSLLRARSSLPHSNWA